MGISRREICALLPVLLGSAAMTAQSAHDKPIGSSVEPFDSLPVHAHGANLSRPILDGMTHEGVHLEVHESVLAPGSSPHPPHHHEHEELFLISTGTLAITIDGKTQTAGAGSAAFIHSGEEHGIVNTGSVPAQYFVVAVGEETA